MRIQGTDWRINLLEQYQQALSWHHQHLLGQRRFLSWCRKNTPYEMDLANVTHPYEKIFKPRAISMRRMNTPRQHLYESY